MSLQDIVRYLMDKLGDSPVDDAENLEEEPGNLRLLQEDQDTISLIKYDKQVKILNSKVLEFDITAYGYIKLNIKL